MSGNCAIVAWAESCFQKAGHQSKAVPGLLPWQRGQHLVSGHATRTIVLGAMSIQLELGLTFSQSVANDDTDDSG